MFGAIYAAEGSSPEALLAVAQEFSPRVDAGSHGRDFREIVLDLHGLTRLFGDTRTIAEELRRTAADRGVQIRVAIAGTRTAARLMVRHRAGLSIIEPGTEAAVLAPLPLALLGELLVNSQFPTSNSQTFEKALLWALGVGNWEFCRDAQCSWNRGAELDRGRGERWRRGGGARAAGAEGGRQRHRR